MSLPRPECITLPGAIDLTSSEEKMRLMSSGAFLSGSSAGKPKPLP